MKDHLIFDTTDATSIKDSDSVGAFVRANDGTLITKHTIAEATYAAIATQGLLLTSKLSGTIGNAYSFTVIDTWTTGPTGPLSFTEVAGAIVVDLYGLTPTIAQIVTLLSTSTYATVTTTTAGSVVVASIQPFTGGTDPTFHQHLDVYSITAASDGTPFTHHHDGDSNSLDVHITNPQVVEVDVDLNGIYSSPANPLPDNVGLIGSVRAAPSLANQTLQFTGAAPSADGVLSNIIAQDVNSFGMMWNGSSWDRMTGASATGLKVDITDATIAVTQSGTWTVGLSEDHNYGAVGATTLRTASQIGNATGAADFNTGAATAQTLRVTLATGADISVSDAALANTAMVSNTRTLPAANTAAVAVTAALANRKYLWLYNFSNKQMFVGGSTVTAANGFPISPGSYMELRAGAASPVYFVGQTGQTPEIRTLEAS